MAQVPPAVVQGPPAVAQVPPAVAQVPPAVVQVPPAVAQVPPAVVQVPPAVVQGPPAVAQVPPAVAQVPPAVAQVPPAVVQVPPAVVQGPPAVVQVPPAVVQGPPAVAQVPPAVVQGPPAVVQVPPAVAQAITDGAMVVINHSGGKDSQAMAAALRAIVPIAQLVVIHAELPGVDWPGVVDHVRDNCQGLEVITCRAGKTLLGMVEKRGMWPSPKYRQCTSDLKRGPIAKVVRRQAKARGWRVVINAMGLRAEESSARAKAQIVKENKRASSQTRRVIDWLPIHDWTVGQVFAAIAQAGQEPHPAYLAGMSRLSCCFCIMASRADLTVAAGLAPDLYRQHVELEARIGHTMRQGATLEQVTGIQAGNAAGDAATRLWLATIAQAGQSIQDPAPIVALASIT